MSKKGFSIIELLFVMVLISSISAIAVQKMNNQDNTIILGLSADAKNIIHVLQSKNVEHTNFATVLPSNISGEGNENGFIYLVDGSALSLTKGNRIDYLNSEGNIGSCNLSNQGFYFILSNSKLPNKYIAFNSCFDNKLKITEISEQDLTPDTTTVTTPVDSTSTTTTDTTTVTTPVVDSTTTTTVDPVTTTTPDIVTIINKKNYKSNKNK